MLYLQSIVNVRCNQESRLTFPLERWLSGLQEPFIVLDIGTAIGLVTSRSGSVLSGRLPEHILLGHLLPLSL